MKKLLLIITAVLTTSSLSFAKLKVVTTTQDLVSIASFIGKDRIALDYIAKGYQDPHFVDAKPSYLLKLSRADLLIAVGLELEVGWLPALIKDCRNNGIVSGKGYLDASTGIEVIEKPTAQLTRAEGDVHPFGNPHYWLDPENGKPIAQNIADRLSQLDPANADFYSKNLDEFNSKLDSKLREWQQILKPYVGTKIVTYHRTWEYFSNHLGLVVVDQIEPKPGIPPTPSHTLDVIQKIKEQNIKVIIVEPFYDLKTPQSISQRSGAKLLVLPTSVGGVPEATDYFQLFDYNLKMLIQNLKN